MAKKLMIGILVLLVVLMGGMGYYSYELRQQIDYLGGQLTAYETEQAARLDALSRDIDTLRTETRFSIAALEDKAGETLAEITALQDEIVTNQDQAARLEEKINGVASQVGNLEDSVSGFSRSFMDAGEVYRKVSQVTVRITNGQNTIGSGFIFDGEAHVLTAQHVIAGLTEIYVILHDGRISRATVTGQDQFSDIAVLKLEDDPAIEPLPLADSGKIRIGEPVVVVGSPFDLPDTLTAGIISQVNRYTSYDTSSNSVANLLQFDAAANPGNSGGPLANSGGEVVGVVVARVSPDEGDGIYYAVAANKAKRVAAALIARGHFNYPWIGVGITDLTPQTVQDRSLETDNGVLVTAVFAESPAEAAGINVNDIIISFDGVPVRDTAGLTSYLGEFKSPGEASTIGLIRGANSLELTIEIGTR